MAKDDDTTREGVSGDVDDAPRATDDVNPRRDNMADIIANRQRVVQAQNDPAPAPAEDDEDDDDPAAAAPGTEEPIRKDGPETGDDGDDDEGGDDEGEVTKTPDEAKTAAKAPSEPMATVILEDGREVKIPVSKVRMTAKVDGAEQDLGGDAVLAGYQMASTGQARIREANERLRQAAEKEREIEARAAQRPAAPTDDAAATSTQPQGNGEDPAASAEAIKQARLKLARTLQFGEEDEVAEALGALETTIANQVRAQIGTTGGAAIDPNDVARSAASMMLQNQQRATTLTTLAEDYPVIFQHQPLVAEGVRQVHMLRAEQLMELGYDPTKFEDGFHGLERVYTQEQTKGTVLDDDRLFRKALDRTTAWGRGLGMDLPEPKAPAAEKQPGKQGNGETREDRRARKAAAGSPPRGATAFDRKAPTPKPTSGSSVVAEIRQGRGQL